MAAYKFTARLSPNANAVRLTFVCALPVLSAVPIFGGLSAYAQMTTGQPFPSMGLQLIGSAALIALILVWWGVVFYRRSRTLVDVSIGDQVAFFHRSGKMIAQAPRSHITCLLYTSPSPRD